MVVTSSLTVAFLGFPARVAAAVSRSIGDTWWRWYLEPSGVAAAIDHVAFALTRDERAGVAERARQYALQFDRHAVFDRLFAPFMPALAQV
jgi:hypothetical protein